MIVQRRSFLMNSAVGLGVALMIPKLASAQAIEEPIPAPAPLPPQISVASEIERNHRHILTLTAVEALSHLRASRDGATVVLDIQGKSGHPHALELTHADLQALFVAGVVEKASTFVAGHDHKVTITMDVI